MMRILMFAVLFVLSLPARAEEGKSAQYCATMTGIVCQSCKSTVIESFKKIPGVTGVDFAKGDKEGTHKLTLTATGELTKNDAERALGGHASEFAIISFEKTRS